MKVAKQGSPLRMLACLQFCARKNAVPVWTG